MHRLGNGTLVVDCQSDYIRLFDYRLVIPLLKASKDTQPVARLQPLLDVGGEQLILVTHLTASVPNRELGRPVLNIEEHGAAIAAALDMLITGF